jgi:hypothetical protein
MQSHESFTSFKGYRYARWAGLLCLGVLGIYIWDDPGGGPRGDSFLGYTLGILGAVIIVWLMFLGARKRAYQRGPGSLTGWLSAHVYLGLALVLIASLHTGLKFHHFGLDIHTATYVVMNLVVASGIWGVVLYRRAPARMSQALDGRGLTELLQLLDDIDVESTSLAARVGGEAEELVRRSLAAPVISGWAGRFTRRHPDCPCAAAARRLEQMGREGRAEITELYLLQARRLHQLQRLRAYLRNKAWTQLWLLFHVPLSFGLLALLFGHIIVVFFYW